MSCTENSTRKYKFTCARERNIFTKREDSETYVTQKEKNSGNVLQGIRNCSLLKFPLIQPNDWKCQHHNGQRVHQWSKRLGFIPRVSHTKDSKHGT